MGYIDVFLSVLRLDIYLEAVALVLSFLIFLRSFSIYLRFRSRSFLFLGSGFLLMSVAMFIRVVFVSLMLISRSITPNIFLLFWIEGLYSILRIVAYIVLILSYVYPALARGDAGEVAVVAPPLFLIYNPMFELMSSVLVIVLSIFSGYNFVSTKAPASMQVFMGFIFLAVSHLFFLTALIDPVNYLLGHVFQLTSLTMLLSATITAGRK